MEEALANIITNSNKVKFDLPVNKCKDISCRDENLPTLIIGYETAKKYIQEFNILKKFYPKQNIYWTFKRNERGVDYEKDLSDFYTTVITDFCEKNTYTFIDLITMNYKMARKLVKSYTNSLFGLFLNRFIIFLGFIPKKSLVESEKPKTVLYFSQ